MADRPDKGTPAEPESDPGAAELRSDLLWVARMQDHLHRLGGRLHFWIAIHALLGAASVITLACYFARGHCCK